ncbi:flagellar motor control protein ZomB, partial [Dietzia sp. UBA5065]|uniref:flagellar motor control protein ZomB n=1 Tax=Dietzia sp. UBA5065 TaxID=1946422 RepID=UPI0025C3D4D7
GPVFNAGERVEANTSTAWTYLTLLGGWVAGPVRLEYVVLALSLALSVAGVVLAMLGAARLYAPSLVGRNALLLPAGALVYIAIPPARDFATSGLETGLALAYIGLLWWMMVCWSQRVRLPVPDPADPTGPAGERRAVAFTAAVSAVAGASVLVRPELALLGVLALLLLFIAAPGWRRRAVVFVAGGLLPVGYQIFRMGYYAILVPHPAIAKDASGAKWGQGFTYLGNLFGPYTLLLPVILAVLVAAVIVATRVRSHDPAQIDPHAHIADDIPDIMEPVASRPRNLAARWVDFQARLQQPSTVVITVATAGALLTLYWLRQGGDFMHGRVLLPSLFLFLLPVSVVPLPVGPAHGPDDARVRRVAVPVVVGAWLVVVGWAVTVQVTQDPFRDQPETITAAGIVDERQYYIQRTGHRHPVLAEDYLDFPRMRALVREVEANDTGAVFLPVPGFQDRWDVVAYDHPLPGMAPFELPDEPIKTVVFLNLGMTSMNLPLDVDVYDTVGLAAPLAAHTDRMEDGRIGHDKFLPYDWVLARTGVIEDPVNLPRWVDVNWVLQSEVALQCPATQALIESYSGPLTPERRWSNLVNAFSFAEYRINRIPAYEVQRCGLPMPEKVEKYQGTR